MKNYIYLLLFFLTVSVCSCAEKNSIIEKLDGIQFEKKFNENTEYPYNLIDVRTPEEFSSGRYSGAVNINFYDENFKIQLEMLDKSIPLFIYCRSGSRSARAAQTAYEAGFSEIYELKGGIISNTGILSIEKDYQ